MSIVRVRRSDIDMDKILSDLAQRPEPSEEEIERWAAEDDSAFSDEELARWEALYPAPPPEEIKAIRDSLGLTQLEFANRFGFSLTEMEQYESGEARPAGAATSLLRVIQLDPDIVVRALHPQAAP